MIDRELQREMPVNLDAEKSVLGSILLENSVMPQAAEVLEPEDFGLDSHRRIYAAMLKLGGKAVDFVTLAEALATNRELEAVGGAAYITSLTDGLPRYGNIEHYCQIVREKSQRRKAINLGSLLIERAYEQTEKVEDVLGKAHEELMRISCDAGNRNSSSWFGHYCDQVITQMWERADRKSDLMGFPTSIPSLDRTTTGIRYGKEAEFWICGARTSVGKSAFGTQVTLSSARQDVPVGVFSIEMSKESLMLRAMVQDGILKPYEARDPKYIPRAQRSEVEKRARELALLPIFVDDSPSLDIREFDAKARLMVAKWKVRMIVLDHIHEMKAKAATTREMFNAIGEGVRQFVKSTGVPVLALCQLARADKTNRGKVPTIDDIRETAALAEKAHVVLFLHRDSRESDAGELEWTGDDVVNVAKQRNGPVGYQPVRYNQDTLCFEDRPL